MWKPPRTSSPDGPQVQSYIAMQVHRQCARLLLCCCCCCCCCRLPGLTWCTSGQAGSPSATSHTCLLSPVGTPLRASRRHSAGLPCDAQVAATSACCLAYHLCSVSSTPTCSASASHLVGQSAIRLVSQPSGRSVSHPVGQSAAQPARCTAGQPVNQAANYSAIQVFSQSVGRLFASCEHRASIQMQALAKPCCFRATPGSGNWQERSCVQQQTPRVSAMDCKDGALHLIRAP
jgi:hypothetical protein